LIDVLTIYRIPVVALSQHDDDQTRGKMARSLTIQAQSDRVLKRREAKGVPFFCEEVSHSHSNSCNPTTEEKQKKAEPQRSARERKRAGQEDTDGPAHSSIFYTFYFQFFRLGLYFLSLLTFVLFVIQSLLSYLIVPFPFYFFTF
jgi:hypothetical protein